MRCARFSSAIAIVLALCLTGCDSAPHRIAPVINLGLRSDAPNGAIMVSAQDDLWDIARRYRLPLRGIIDLNNLQPPYALHAGMRLKLPAPVDYHVRHGDTLYSIANMFNVSMSQMVAVNDMRAPYILHSGELLRIPFIVQGQRVHERIAETWRPRPVKREPEYVRHRDHVVYERYARRSPSVFIWPVRGRIISGYGSKGGGLYNDGINIAAPRGTPVAAAASGVVAYVGDALKSYGNLVLIRHGGGMMTAYAHLAAIRARKGMTVRKGEVIGTVGSTGTVSASQLHFEIRRGSRAYNPLSYLK